MNGRQMFIKEKLPPKDKELKVYANDNNLVTRTQNCQVQLMIQNNGIRKIIDVNSLKTSMTISLLQCKESKAGQWVPKRL